MKISPVGFLSFLLFIVKKIFQYLPAQRYLFHEDVKRVFKRKKIQSENLSDNLAFIHFVCFSYSGDFKILKLCFESFKINCNSIPCRFNLIVDKKSPFNDLQLQELKKSLGRDINILETKYPHDHKGASIFINEVIAFEEIAKDVNPADLICKIDSDLLFTHSSFFEYCINDINHDGFFQDARTTVPKENWPFYSQGGCYMIRARKILEKSNNSLFLNQFKVFLYFLKYGVVRPFWQLGEDASIYNLYLNDGNALVLNFYVKCKFRKESQNWIEPDYPSVIHFERCQESLPSFFETHIKK